MHSCRVCLGCVSFACPLLSGACHVCQTGVGCVSGGSAACRLLSGGLHVLVVSCAWRRCVTCCRMRVGCWQGCIGSGAAGCVPQPPPNSVENGGRGGGVRRTYGWVDQWIALAASIGAGQTYSAVLPVVPAWVSNPWRVRTIQPARIAHRFGGVVNSNAVCIGSTRGRAGAFRVGARFSHHSV